MEIQLHADDLGLTPEINRAIFDLADQGLLDSVSLIVNGPVIDDALQGLRQRPWLRWNLHINLVEGCPVSPIGDVPLLVDERGQFRHSFLGILIRSMPVYRPRPQFRLQIATEIRNQIRFVQRELSPTALRVDSHQHTHIIPMIASLVHRLARANRMEYIRGVRDLIEPGLRDWYRFSAWMNAGKSLLLRILQFGNDRRHYAFWKGAADADDAQERIIGIFLSGGMKLPAIARTLARIDRQTKGQAKVLLLFHPGDYSGGGPETVTLQEGHQSQFFDYCSLAARNQEYQTMLSAELRVLLAEFRGASQRN
ncbi:MAG: ChbG/HpnK family deacetylase [Leptospiraceae bacterium]|nr:ChbG/HpnK family deacetylase [Leptospiraceae bacterium]